MYQKIFFTFLEVSIVVSIIVVITFFCLSFIDKRYGFKWRKILWIILAVRLLVPYTFTLADAPIHLFQSEKILVQDGKRVYLTEYTSNKVTQEQVKSDAKPASAERVEQNKHIPSEDAFQIPVLLLLGMIWGIGAFVYLRNQQINYQYFLRDLDESLPVTAGPTYELLRDVCQKLHINKVPDLYRNQTVKTPFIIGYFKPVLFLPEKRYSIKELEFIFHHECTHYKNHDLLYKLIITIAVGIHWFNPVIHYMKTLAFRDVELVCDQKMAKKLSTEEKRLYCNTLIHTASEDRFKELDLSTCFLGNKKILKQRIQNIFDRNARKRGILPIFCILGIMLICGASISCGRDVKIPKAVKKEKEQKTEKKEEKKQDPVTYVLPISSEKKETLYLDQPFQLENYYCRQARNQRNNYKIDENQVLWEGEHILAEHVIHIVANDYFDDSALLYLTESGELYGVGSNSHIFFTDPLNSVVIEKPKLLMENVKYVDCGTMSVTVLKTDGSVWVWGTYDTVGFTDSDRIYPDSSWEGAGITYYEPVCVLKNAVYITSSYNIAAAITDQGELWTWGSNLYGECGLDEKETDAAFAGKRMQNVKFVWLAENESQTYIQKDDGSLWVCGKDIGKETKTIDYGTESVPNLQKVTCTAQFMPLILEEK